MLAVSYNPILLSGAILLAVMSGVTGLSLTNGLSGLNASQRKPMIVKSAAVLGGGIWATHFVAMLAMQLPVEVFYDPVYTLASALIAILMTGGALLLLHFGARSQKDIVAAGSIMGLGVVAMHYVGMYGMRGCLPVFHIPGYVISSILAAAICIGAMQVAYNRRSLRGIVVGGATYGLAILVMHFSAMHQTGFFPLDQVQPSIRMVPNDVLALLVIFVAFLICGAFLLTTVTMQSGIVDASMPNPSDQGAMSDRSPDPRTETTTPEPVVPHGPVEPVVDPFVRRLPYEQDGKTFFAAIDDVVAIQAEGHYTRLHRVSGEVFCPLAIAKLADDLKGSPFLRTHRSYLVNLGYVQGFERRKDQGVCLFAPEIGIDPIPVSRSNVSATMRALGI